MLDPWGGSDHGANARHNPGGEANMLSKDLTRGVELGLCVGPQSQGPGGWGLSENLNPGGHNYDIQSSLGKVAGRPKASGSGPSARG